MARNERLTCKEVIEPALGAAGWSWQEQLRIGPGKVNLTGDSMYDETQSIIADYLLRYRSVPLLILEAKAEGESAADGMQQASRYARRLSIRYSLASNGAEWILTDNETGDYEALQAAPTPEEVIARLGVSIDWPRWEGSFAATYQRVRRRLRGGDAPWRRIGFVAQCGGCWAWYASTSKSALASIADPAFVKKGAVQSGFCG